MCLVVLFGLLVPRLTLALLWFFTSPAWTRVLEPWWLGVLGFLFLPFTTLSYVVIHHYSGMVSVQNIAHLVIMLIAVVVDLGAWGGSRTHYRVRRAR